MGVGDVSDKRGILARLIGFFDLKSRHRLEHRLVEAVAGAALGSHAKAIPDAAAYINSASVCARGGGNLTAIAPDVSSPYG